MAEQPLKRMNDLRTQRIVLALAGILMILCAGLYFFNYTKQTQLSKRLLKIELKINEMDKIYKTYLTSVLEKRRFQFNPNKSYLDRFLEFDSNAKKLLEELPKSDLDIPAFDQNFTYLKDKLKERSDRMSVQMSYFLEFDMEQARAKIIDEEEVVMVLSHEVEGAFFRLEESLRSEKEKLVLENESLIMTNYIGFLALVMVAVGLIAGVYFLSQKAFSFELEREIQAQKLRSLRQDMLDFSSTFESSAIGMGLLDSYGNWIKVNRSLCYMLEYSMEELLTLSFQEITHPEDLFEDLDKAKKLFNREIESYNLEKRYLSKSGKIVWVNLIASAVWDDEVNFKHFIAQMEEISLRKKFLDTLQEQNSRLANVLEGTGVGTWEWNVQTGEAIYNEKWAEILGYSLEDLEPVSQETWSEFVHSEDLETSNKKIQDYFSSKTDFYECEYRMRHKNGHWVWILDRGKVMRWLPDGRPEVMFGTHSDISRFKEMEFSLMSKNAFAAAVLDTIDVGIVACDADGRLNLFNKATLEFHGLDSSDIPQEEWSNYYQLYHIDGSTLLEKEEVPLYRAWLSEEIDGVEICIKHVTGKVRYFKCFGGPVQGDDGSFLGAVIAMSDISFKFQGKTIG